MVKLKCRSCGGDVASDEKARKCRHCNELFPFACAVCDKHLRPPIPEYPIERYYNDDSEPLCADHYQRECPECGKWFRADENPGFFLCADCTQRREAGETGEAPVHRNFVDTNSASEIDDDDGDNLHENAELSARSAAKNSAAKKSGGCVGVFVLALMSTATPIAWLLVRALSNL